MAKPYQCFQSQGHVTHLNRTCSAGLVIENIQRCIFSSAKPLAVTLHRLMMMTSIISEESLARNTHTHARPISTYCSTVSSTTTKECQPGPDICPCSTAPMTVQHTLQDCHFYHNQRVSTWPTDTAVREKIFGPVESLQRTSAFTRATGVPVFELESTLIWTTFSGHSNESPLWYERLIDWLIDCFNSGKTIWTTFGGHSSESPIWYERRLVDIRVRVHSDDDSWTIERVHSLNDYSWTFEWESSSSFCVQMPVWSCQNWRWLFLVNWAVVWSFSFMDPHSLSRKSAPDGHSESQLFLW